MHSRVVALAAVALMLGGCSSLDPEPVSGNQSIVVVTYDPSNESYSLQPQNVTTLHDLRTMQGLTANVEVNATVNASFPALVAANATTAAAVQSATVTKAGEPPDFNYFTVSGAIYPADNDSMNVATAYYEMEQAYLFFEQSKAQLPTTPDLYYVPTLTVSTGAPASVTDLGFTDPWLGYFAIPTASSSGWLEPGLQPGIVAYQYAQAVFAQQVFGNAGLTWLDVAANQSPGVYAPTYNIVRSVNAAFSDAFAAIIVADPDFVHTSGATIDETRRLDPMTPRCLTSSISNDIATKSRASYNPHELGSILSVVFYTIYTDRTDAQQSYTANLISMMGTFGQYLDTQQSAVSNMPITLADVAENLAENVGSNFQPELCGLLLDRLSLTASQVASCGEAMLPEASCAP